MSGTITRLELDGSVARWRTATATTIRFTMCLRSAASRRRRESSSPLSRHARSCISAPLPVNGPPSAPTTRRRTPRSWPTNTRPARSSGRARPRICRGCSSAGLRASCSPRSASPRWPAGASGLCRQSRRVRRIYGRWPAFLEARDNRGHVRCAGRRRHADFAQLYGRL